MHGCVLKFSVQVKHTRGSDGSVLFVTVSAVCVFLITLNVESVYIYTANCKLDLWGYTRYKLAQSKQTRLAGLIGSREHNYVKEKKRKSSRLSSAHEQFN